MKKLILTSIIGCLALTSFCQQPFEQYGYKAKVATLSNGKYHEFFDQDSLVQIGTVVMNRITGKLMYFVTNDTSYSESNLQPEIVSRWISQDPHAERYYSYSPYNFAVNNPILFNDPDGRDIVFYQTSSEGDRKKVSFNQLDKTLQKAITAFAKTEAGNAFLSQFAKKGDNIGGVKFSKDGAFSKHDFSFAQHNTPTEGEAAVSSYSVKDGKATFEANVNLAGEPNEAEEAHAIGHETFLHIDTYDDRLIDAVDKNDKKAISNIVKERREIAADRNGGPDHDAYLNKQGGYSKFNAYSSQLKAVMNPTEVDKARNKHDDAVRKGN